MASRFKDQNELLKYLEATKDEANLTDDELQGRIDAFTEAKDIKGKRTIKDANALADQIYNYIYNLDSREFSNSDYWNPALREASSYVANTLLNGGYINPTVFAESMQYGLSKAGKPLLNSQKFEEIKTRAGAVQETFLPRVVGNQYTKDEEYSIYPNAPEDLKRVGGLLSDRKLKAEREKQVDESVQSLRDELGRGRETYLDYLQQEGEDQFNDLSPRIAQTLNARGLLYSGDLESELNRGAAEIFNPIQDAALQLQQEDDEFFQNAAYQTTLRREIEAGRDVTGQVANARDQIRTNQEQSFQRTQAQLRHQYQEDSFARQQDRELKAQEARLKREREIQDDQNRAGVIGGVAQTLGQIGGAYIGSRVSSGGGGGSSGSSGGGTSSKGVTSA